MTKLEYNDDNELFLSWEARIVSVELNVLLVCGCDAGQRFASKFWHDFQYRYLQTHVCFNYRIYHFCSITYYLWLLFTFLTNCVKYNALQPGKWQSRLANLNSYHAQGAHASKRHTHTEHVCVHAHRTHTHTHTQVKLISLNRVW